MSSSLDNFAALLAEKRQRDKRRQRLLLLQRQKQHSSKNSKQHYVVDADADAASWALPVVSNKEIGSTWIFGVSSDSTKLAWCVPGKF